MSLTQSSGFRAPVSPCQAPFSSFPAAGWACADLSRAGRSCGVSLFMCRYSFKFQGMDKKGWKFARVFSFFRSLSLALILFGIDMCCAWTSQSILGTNSILQPLFETSLGQWRCSRRNLMSIPLHVHDSWVGLWLKFGSLTCLLANRCTWERARCKPTLAYYIQRRRGSHQ